MFDRDKQEYILTDPVIVSNTEYLSASYGPCDGGLEMMKVWFRYHKCNRYCKRKWLKLEWDESVQDIKPSQNTTYVWQVGNDNNKNKNKNKNKRKNKKDSQRSKAEETDSEETI